MVECDEDPKVERLRLILPPWLEVEGGRAWVKNVKDIAAPNSPDMKFYASPRQMGPKNFERDPLLWYSTGLYQVLMHEMMEWMHFADAGRYASPHWGEYNPSRNADLPRFFFQSWLRS